MFGPEFSGLHGNLDYGVSVYRKTTVFTYNSYGFGLPEDYCIYI